MSTGRQLIFGGSFDPVHVGHLIVARAVAEQTGHDRVVLMPTGVNPLKAPPQATTAQRLAMLALAVQDAPFFTVSDLEIRRDPPHYTIDTVREWLRTQGGAVSLLVGADMIGDLHRWHEAEELLELADLVVTVRPPHDFHQLREVIDRLGGELPADQIERLKGQLTDAPLIDLSSTAIRGRCKAGKSIRFMVPDAVCDYIFRNNLYA